MTTKVTISDTENVITTFNIEIKHFRQYDDRGRVKLNGGNTIVFDHEKGIMAFSKCRRDEPFGRRKGVLVCIHKLLKRMDSRYRISTYKFEDGEIFITASITSSDKNLEWYL